MSKQKNGREFKSKGVSALPDWWETVEGEAQSMGLTKSSFIRMAVNYFLRKRPDHFEDIRAN